MQTPASLWLPSPRPYREYPPAWEYQQGAEVHRLGHNGRLTPDGRRWQIASPLAGEVVEIVRIDQRALVFYRTTLIRELNFATQGSIMVRTLSGEAEL